MHSVSQKQYLSDLRELVDKAPQHEILKATENSVMSFFNELIKLTLKQEKDSKSMFLF